MHWISWNIACSLLLLRHSGWFTWNWIVFLPLAMLNIFIISQSPLRTEDRRLVEAAEEIEKIATIIGILRLNNSIPCARDFLLLSLNFYFLGKEMRKITFLCKFSYYFSFDSLAPHIIIVVDHRQSCDFVTIRRTTIIIRRIFL